jgi:hypothetical protein
MPDLFAEAAKRPDTTLRAMKVGRREPPYLNELTPVLSFVVCRRSNSWPA